MKFMGFVIEPQYMPGADFKVLRDGTVRDVKPKKEHIDFYWVEDTKDVGFRFTAKTVEEAKERCWRYRAIEEALDVAGNTIQA